MKVARTRPATVAFSSSVVMSKAVPWITEPSRESVTGSSGPEPLGVGVPVDHAGVHTEPVARGDDHVLPHFDVLGLLIEVSLVAEDHPGAILLEHPHGEVPEIRPPLLVVHQGLLRLAAASGRRSSPLRDRRP